MTNEKNDREDQILQRLDAIVALLAQNSEDPYKSAEILRSCGFTFKQTSTITGIPEGTLKTRSRAQRLRDNSQAEHD